MTIEEEKEKMRRLMREKLSAQPESDRVTKSSLIAGKLIREKVFQNAKCVMMYASLEYEVDTAKLISFLLEQKKQVALPCVDSSSGLLKPYEIHDLEKDTQKGNYGIREPLLSRCQMINPSSLDLVVVPGLAFDHAQCRLGRGKGFYDKFLAKLSPKVTTLGLAFNFQIVPHLPASELDVPVKRVIHD